MPANQKLAELLAAKAKSKPTPKIVKVPPREKSGSGKPLPKEVLEAAESAFGADLSKVRIHEDPSVAQLTESMGARAYVSGNDIVFAPGASKDPKLLAHELAHVLQQRSSPKPGEGSVAK